MLIQIIRGTTDGVYRETRGKLRKYKSGGVVVVNMETSAIFAVAKYRKVEAASPQIISDILTEKGWLQASQRRKIETFWFVELLRTIFHLR